MSKSKELKLIIILPLRKLRWKLRFLNVVTLKVTLELTIGCCGKAWGATKPGGAENPGGGACIGDPSLSTNCGRGESVCSHKIIKQY